VPHSEDNRRLHHVVEPAALDMAEAADIRRVAGRVVVAGMDRVAGIVAAEALEREVFLRLAVSVSSLL
jgi:hypothetical protein